MNNPVNWFEIPASDLERAKEFYAKVFNSEFQYIEMPGSKMYIFSGGPGSPGSMGCIFKDENAKPSAEGLTVYFNCEDVAVETARVEEAGGNLIMTKMSIGEFGFVAQCIDTEGNRIGFHSNK